ncbi:MAG: hypothetical protein QM784_00225 [Polyangiaceae bacterium]
MTQRHQQYRRVSSTCLQWAGSALLLGLFVACSKKAGPVSTKEDPLRRGDIIVAEPTAAEFFEGRVLDVMSTSLKVQRIDSGEVITVGRADVYRLGSEMRITESSAYAICAFNEHHWEGCRVLRREGPEVWVLDTGSTQHRLALSRVMVPTGLSAMNIQRRFEEAGRRQAFERAISAAGMPRAVSGWSPAVHRLVLAERNGRWYGASNRRGRR